MIPALPELRKVRANLETRVCGRDRWHPRLSLELDRIIVLEEAKFAAVLDELARLEEGRT